MPRGRGGGGGGRKGGRRQFTNFEAESEKKEREEKEARWRAQRGEADSEEEKEGSGSEESGSETESSEEEGELKAAKPKGVSGLIEQRNPNRMGVKANRKVTDLPEGGVKVELSRREREEIKKQQYIKLQEECKTDQARADLERLAVIRARRAEAEAKRKEEMEAKEAANASKKEAPPSKVSGKKKS